MTENIKDKYMTTQQQQSTSLVAAADQHFQSSPKRPLLAKSKTAKFINAAATVPTQAGGDGKRSVPRLALQKIASASTEVLLPAASGIAGIANRDSLLTAGAA